MSRYMQFVILFIYMAIFFFGTFYWVSIIFTVNDFFPEAIFYFLIFCLFCYSSVYWLPWAYLLTNHIRRPLKKEREYLEECFSEVCVRCRETRKYNLFIFEMQEQGAFSFGINNIVVSRPFIERRPRGEVEAVLAHELGHLRTRDTIAGCMLSVAGWIPQQLAKAWRLLLKYIRVSFTRHIVAWTVVFLALGLMAVYSARGNSIIIILMLFALNNALYGIFLFAWRMTMRFTECRQDEFAASLGYAEPLKDALEKFNSLPGVEDISVWHNIIHSSYPLLHNRILRLEKHAEKYPAYYPSI